MSPSNIVNPSSLTIRFDLDPSSMSSYPNVNPSLKGTIEDTKLYFPTLFMSIRLWVTDSLLSIRLQCFFPLKPMRFQYALFN